MVTDVSGVAQSVGRRDLAGASTRVRVAIAATVVTTALLAGLQVVLITMSWPDPEANAYFWRPNSLAWVCIGTVFAAVGAIIARRRPGNPIGWLLVALGVTAALFNATAGYVDADLQAVGRQTLGPAMVGLWVRGRM